MTHHVASYYNRASDIEVTVTQLASGEYGVQVRDVDANQTLPITVRFAGVEQAKAYALLCAAGVDEETA